MRGESIKPQMPLSLDSFKGVHHGETIIVCGCGESLNLLELPEQAVTIGVNDVGRRFTPNYLVVVNPRSQFKAGRFQYVASSRAQYVFTQLPNLGIPHPRIVRFRLGKYGGTDFSDPKVLHYTQNSPYVALCLAAHMGARRIGLIGVDFTDHHFFASTGAHALGRKLAAIDAEYRRLVEALRARGVEVFNLSPVSRLTAIPRMPLAGFAPPAGQAAGIATAQPSLTIVSYATTPVAGVPAVLARCIAARTAHRARCVWANNGYGNGVVFTGDVEWSRDARGAEELLGTADLVIVHNGKADPRHQRLLAGKPVITMAHNYGWNVDQRFVRAGFPGVVVGQYQATLPEFAGWPVVPNPVPLWEPDYQRVRKNAAVTICYTPSGRHERYPRNHRLYWHSKGYDSTLRVLERVARRHRLQVESVGDRQVAHAESLAMKRRAHIVIDECVTGSYHRNSLEGLALGCVVLNGVGLVPDIEQALRRCAPDAQALPFVRADLGNLEQVLDGLAGEGAASLAARGRELRCWMEQHWDFSRQWDRFWRPVVEQAMNRTIRTGRRVNMQRGSNLAKAQRVPARPAVATEGVSAIVVHAGAERLPLLAGMVASLKQSPEVDQVIIVDVGDAPRAHALAERWGADYVYAPAPGPFNRARAVNIGCGLARNEFLLWSDNDLLYSPGLVQTAMGELLARNLDFLIPYARIHYLNERDSLAVLAGTQDPAQCAPLAVLGSGPGGAADGGVGLVRADFVRRYGALCEEFRGWGGEDNAWTHKVSVLGRAGATAAKGQTVYHLYHAGTGGLGGDPWKRNPDHYGHNLALLEEIRKQRSRDAYLNKYPPPAHHTCPWSHAKGILIVGSPDSGALAEHQQHLQSALSTGYGISATVVDPAQLPAAVHGRDGSDAALVIMGRAAARTVLSDEGLRRWWDRSVTVLEPGAADVASDKEVMSRAAVMVVAEPDAVEPLRRLGCAVWHRPWSAGGKAFRPGVPVVVQPLSLLLAACPPAPTRMSANRTVAADRPAPLPVWMYWEGERPEWIRNCERTVQGHAADVRILGPDDFDRLWDRDRDINLTRLHVVQRADYIRAFLLTRYGGLWIDSDCVVMKPLAPVIAMLESQEFVAHKERKGWYGNDFMGASPGSRIAAAIYARICQQLRSGRPIGWTALGCEVVTAVLRSTSAPWRELDCELIQPICWSRPAPYFEVATPEEHDRNLDPRALCYMLSNQEAQKFAAAHPGRQLMDDGSFFRHLIDHSQQPSAPLAAPGHAIEHIPFFLDAMADLAPTSVQDIGVGSGRWALLLREIHARAATAPARRPASLRLEGIALQPDGPQKPLKLQKLLYDRVVTATAETVEQHLTGNWELALFGEDLDGLPKEQSVRLLERVLESADYVLLGRWLQEQPVASGGTHPVRWSLGECLGSDVVRHSLCHRHRGIAYGAFLLSRRDPRGLKPASPIAPVFARMAQECSRWKMESVSGPGSSLCQTMEIRQRLPQLLQSIGALSLLDAPCGDFNWMKHVVHGVQEYTGVDILEDLIGANQQRYAGNGRKFLRLDLSSDVLPRADVILCRDCLVHFSAHDVLRSLANFKRCGADYLLTTTFPRRSANEDIPTGGWRPINLELAPFCFPPPLRVINERCTEDGGRYADKSLGLWRLSDLPI